MQRSSWKMVTVERLLLDRYQADFMISLEDLAEIGVRFSHWILLCAYDWRWLNMEPPSLRSLQFSWDVLARKPLSWYFTFIELDQRMVCGSIPSCSLWLAVSNCCALITADRWDVGPHYSWIIRRKTFDDWFLYWQILHVKFHQVDAWCTLAKGFVLGRVRR